MEYICTHGHTETHVYTTPFRTTHINAIDTVLHIHLCILKSPQCELEGKLLLLHQHFLSRKLQFDMATNGREIERQGNE
ncbi:hypothetical protein XELAEV_18029830mg [Xenopus laevis]|uniref:Uncharacterized protein n=1 Tax=Xenopus laevis TaxID=8355 RepID=A0A974CU63_XENLA|nr:hypothetical protein XELAEV_18029830mg [Xenopus laevis]